MLLAVLQNGGRPGLLLFDPHLPGSGLLPGLRHLRQAFPDMPVLVMSTMDNTLLARECLRLGAGAYLLKTTSGDTLCEAIHAIVAGDRCLAVATRTQAVLKFAAAGGGAWSEGGAPVPAKAAGHIEYTRLGEVRNSGVSAKTLCAITDCEKLM